MLLSAGDRGITLTILLWDYFMALGCGQGQQCYYHQLDRATWNHAEHLPLALMSSSNPAASRTGSLRAQHPEVPSTKTLSHSLCTLGFTGISLMPGSRHCHAHLSPRRASPGGMGSKEWHTAPGALMTGLFWELVSIHHLSGSALGWQVVW